MVDGHSSGGKMRMSQQPRRTGYGRSRGETAVDHSLPSLPPRRFVGAAPAFDHSTGTWETGRVNPEGDVPVDVTSSPSHVGASRWEASYRPSDLDRTSELSQSLPRGVNTAFTCPKVIGRPQCVSK
ncbi:hypothetical protein B296_00000207 [Ensete ventricosum]|uniref:Uncharacterized protein n=1 Tax=Ensete ventricosum TaxID=4639 RepID=A0A427BC88_ENSVE|nr:hypothetical protein B296_00000207 [Ensete ventricosum]